ncbi:hypothetical protein [Halocatena salina]|uniref:Uncharacterized protein n=1 Tax=Halocatena salina TaxID=2934340 RepID=A0A8U0A029_9EURY|nr:hypothetical protein [Halocatena salina]UPM41748.1 hypothetical protein MW046_07040 [Halocatena salina]
MRIYSSGLERRIDRLHRALRAFFVREPWTLVIHPSVATELTHETRSTRDIEPFNRRSRKDDEDGDCSR